MIETMSESKYRSETQIKSTRTKRWEKMKAELVNVIRTDTTEGIGTEESPVRTIRRYWTLDGKLISEKVLLQQKE